MQSDDRKETIILKFEKMKFEANLSKQNRGWGRDPAVGAPRDRWVAIIVTRAETDEGRRVSKQAAWFFFDFTHNKGQREAEKIL